VPLKRLLLKISKLATRNLKLETNTMSDKKKPSTKPDPSKELQTQLADLDAKYKRALADYQNLTKQHQKERQEYLKYANSSLITQFLPLLDNLKMAYQHLPDPGLEMIIKQFQQILTDEGIQEINPQPGESFFEGEQECIETLEGSAEQQNQIAEVSQTGYKYTSGYVIRHAKVKVYKNTETITTP